MLQAPVASYRALPPLLHGALVPAVMPVCVVVRKCAVVRRHPQRSWNIWLLRKIRYLMETVAQLWDLGWRTGATATARRARRCAAPANCSSRGLRRAEGDEDV